MTPLLAHLAIAVHPAMAAQDEPRCDTTLLEVSLDALDPQLEDAAVARITASDLLDACTFDRKVSKALQALADGEAPEDADLHGRFLRPICDSSIEDGRDAVWSGCAMRTAGVVSRNEWDAATGPIVLPVVVYDTLLPLTSRDTAQVVFRRLAGVPRLASKDEPAVIDTFEPLFPVY